MKAAKVRTAPEIGPFVLVDGVLGERRLTQSCGLASIAAYVRSRGLEVTLFAPNNRRMTPEEAAAWLARREPAFVGVSMLSRFQYPAFRAMAGALRRAGWRGLLCAGGHWASLAYERLLTETPELDLCVVGDGEEAAADVLGHLAAAGGDPPGGWEIYPGLAFRDPGGRIRYTGRRVLGALDELPPMADDLITELVREYGPTVRIGLVSSRGCYGNCSYCSVRAFNRLQGARFYRLRSLERVIEEMEMIHRRFGTTNFSFEDDNFLLPGRRGVERSRELADRLEERRLALDLWVQTRPECLTLEAVTYLKKAGVRTIFVGAESFDPDSLTLFNRGNTVEQNLRALEVLQSLGYSCDVDAEYRVKFGAIVFHPYVTLAALRAQAPYFRRFRIPTGKLLRRLRPGGDAPLCLRLEEEGLVDEEGEYLFVRPEVTEVYWTLRRFFDEYYPLRDDIRTVEKKSRQHGLADDLEPLRAVRRAVEDGVIDLFEELCREGEKGREAIRGCYRGVRSSLEARFDLPSVRREVVDRLRDLAGYSMNR